MSFFDTLFRKLGFSMEEGEERGEEIDDSEEQEEEGEDETQGSRFSFRFGNPFKGVPSEEEEEPEEEPSRTRRGNVIHDSRMDARAAQEAQALHRTRIVNVRQIEECHEKGQPVLVGTWRTSIPRIAAAWSICLAARRLRSRAVCSRLRIFPTCWRRRA